MMLVEGSGCARAFVCPYHASVYGLTGELQRVADPHGFPDLDQAEHGLVHFHRTLTAHLDELVPQA
jgi:phenylpropionate dioxygenase-like ring-hydroxylating dioxygenase large terminal subunit